VRDIVDSGGDVLNHLTYDTYGQVTSETNAAVDHIFGFTGRERDEETDLQYNRARYYDPQAGRWISEDPLGFAAGDTNVNRYVANSPVNFVDPSGRDLQSTFVSIDWDPDIGNAPLDEWKDYIEAPPDYGDTQGGDDGNDTGGGIPPAGPGGHDSKKSPSNRNRHEGGDKRRLVDRGGEKGDQRRRPPRRRPHNWRGPWPPTTQEFVAAGAGIGIGYLVYQIGKDVIAVGLAPETGGASLGLCFVP
jgi:RHS repeat-associated protein